MLYYISFIVNYIHEGQWKCTSPSYFFPLVRIFLSIRYTNVYYMFSCYCFFCAEAKIRNMQKDYPKFMNFIMKTKSDITRARFKLLSEEINNLKSEIKDFGEQQKPGDETVHDQSSEVRETATSDDEEQEVTSPVEKDSGKDEFELPTKEEWNEVEEWLSFSKGKYYIQI